MRKIKKLNYKQIEYKDLIINFSKSRCRTMHITIKQDGNVYYVVPYFVSESETLKFLDDKYEWIKKSLTKMKEKTSDTDDNDILNNNKRLTKEERQLLIYKINEYVKKY